MLDDDQELIHDDLARALGLDEGEVLTGWVIAYEVAQPEGDAYAGHAYGPGGMTSWRALGLLEWVRNVTIPRAVVATQDDE